MNELEHIADIIHSLQWFTYLLGAAFLFAAFFKGLRRELGAFIGCLSSGLVIIGMPVLLSALLPSPQTPGRAVEPSNSPVPTPPTPTPATPAPKAAAVDFSWLPGALIILAIGLVGALLLWCVVHYAAPAWTRRRSAKRFARDLTAAARKTLNAVVLESASYETDLAKQIDYPIMTDVSEPLVGTYIREMRTVQELDRALGDAPTVDEAKAFSEAAAHLDVSFKAAVARAEKVRWSSFTAEERKRLKDARTALAVIQDSSTTAEQRNAQYKRITRLLEGLIALTEPVKLALGEWVPMLAIEEATPTAKAGK